MPPAPIRNDRNNNSNNETISNLLSTSITSPIRRIPSFIDDEEPVEVNFSLLETKSPVNKKKRSHPAHPHENNFGQLNRSQDFDEIEGKRLVNANTLESPLRKRPSNISNNSRQIQERQSTPSPSCSIGSQFRKYRRILDEHRENKDFDAWIRDICQVGKFLLETSGEESAAAGIICDLIDELKRELARLNGSIIIPTVCGNIFIDKLLAKALSFLGRNEEALEVCKSSFKDAGSESCTNDELLNVAKIEIKYLEGCLSRAVGKNSRAIEVFQQVLKLDPDHSEAHDHLYGATCGLLHYQARNGEEDSVIQAYNRADYKRVIELTRETIWTRWLGDESVLVFLASSLACKFDSGALYSLGQRCVNQRPESSVSWYCVGLFYQVIGKSDEARRYLFKAGIGSKSRRQGAPDPGIGPGWIALGHSFAAYGDHEQAVSAYVAAIKTHCPGSLEPSLFLAIEYFRVRQPVLAAAYLLDAHAADPNDSRVLNELACLQVGKKNFPAAIKLLNRAVETSLILPPSHRIVMALNLCIAKVKELMSEESHFESVRDCLRNCSIDIMKPLLRFVKMTIETDGSSSNSFSSTSLSLFPWTTNSAHPSAEYTFLFTYCIIQEWLAILNSSNSEESTRFMEDSLEGYGMLLECRNHHRNLSLETLIAERQNRLLSAHSTISTNKNRTYQVPLKEERPLGNNFNNIGAIFKTPRTPLIRSHSLAMMDSLSSGSNSNLSFISASQHTPNLSFSTGALPTISALAGLESAASSIAASVSRRRLSLRRQMTGLRFDPADTSASFSSFESDNSFISATGTALVTSTQLNEDLMMTTTASTLIINQSMMLTDIEADCEFLEKTDEIEDEDDMRLDSD